MSAGNQEARGGGRSVGGSRKGFDGLLLLDSCWLGHFDRESDGSMIMNHVRHKEGNNDCEDRWASFRVPT